MTTGLNLHQWAEVFAAIGTTISVMFLTWDRFRPRPLQISGYLQASRTRIPDAVSCEVYLFSETGERLILTEISGGHFYDVADSDAVTPIAILKGNYSLTWEPYLSLRSVSERGQTGDAALHTLFVRERKQHGRFAGWARRSGRSGLRVSGVLPYRSRGKTFTVWLEIPEGDLLFALRNFRNVGDRPDG